MARHRPEHGRGASRFRRRFAWERSPSPFPALEGVSPHPRWWERLRGIFGMSILVALLGVLTAVALAVLLAIMVVAVVSTIA